MISSQLLLMEDDQDVASLYCRVLKDRGHAVTHVSTTEGCLKVYSESLYRLQTERNILRNFQPYDAAIVDYKMPDRNGLEVAKEILAINSHQRIIFVSAFAEERLFDCVKIPVEFLQKPVSNKKLLDTIEQTEIYEELERLNIDAEAFKKAHINHEGLIEIIAVIKKSQSGELGQYLSACTKRRFR